MTPDAPAPPEIPAISIDSPDAYLNRELSWLNFAGRVLALVHDPGVPLLERVKFAGIVGMLHDEFFMKRVGGLKRRIVRGSERLTVDGRRPQEELEACREEVLNQVGLIARTIRQAILPALEAEGIHLVDYSRLDVDEQQFAREYFRSSVEPILTPLAVDAEHPFPFISNLGLNLAVQIPDGAGRKRFLRIKVPANRPRWVRLGSGRTFVALEQIIAANLDLLFPDAPAIHPYLFRVTRGAEGDGAQDQDLDDQDALEMPGSIIRQVSNELKARRFAGVVRLQVSADMPAGLQRWLARQLRAEPADIYPTDTYLGLNDLVRLEVEDRDDLRYPPHEPVTHPRLRHLDPDEPGSIFEEIRKGDLLLHHPYQSFDTSVVRFLESAALDPRVLAIKLTIYRTSSDSPIVRALLEASKRGKQVAVLVEITARFDEAPNIEWGKLLEQGGVHVSYGVRKLKTHVKLALVVREEGDGIRRYVHVGTGNYHTGTARLYEDVGILTCCPAELCDDVARVFNELTGATPNSSYRRLVLAPKHVRSRLVEMIRREATHAQNGRPSGIRAKMNQLEDVEIVRELYRAGQAGVPIALNVRGLCRLRPGVPGLSENIRVFGLVGRFLEHSRIYVFQNGGHVEYYIGSLDWMKRNLDSRVETLMPVTDPRIQRELLELLDVYEKDNCTVWDCGPNGAYTRRRPAPGEPRYAAQEVFIEAACQAG